MYRNARALVISSQRSREADKVVGLFTREFGRLTARATSAARSTAKFAALTEPFVECDVALYTGLDQGWGKIVGGRLIRSFPHLRSDLERSTAGAWVCEMAFRLTPIEQPSPEKYDLLVEALEALETATSTETLRLGFATRFLSHAGFGLDHREQWIAFVKEHPDWGQAIQQAPLMELGQMQWKSPAVSALAHLAGSVVMDQLHKPMMVNRFRQMTGIEI